MRADKRSFSFTWMRGQKNSGGQRNGTVTADSVNTEQPNTSWYMTTASSTSSSSGVSSMSESSSISSTNHTVTDEPGNENPSLSKSDNSKSRLRRLGSSFTRFGTKYSIIEDDDETQVPLEFENQVAMETEDQPMEQEPTEPDPVKEPVHFDEDGNFIGRSGKANCPRRKSTTCGKEVGTVAGTSSSFGRKLNKTMQDVKTSLGNFSQVGCTFIQCILYSSFIKCLKYCVSCVEI